MIEWSLVTSQNREIKNDKRVAIFSKLQLRIKKYQRNENKKVSLFFTDTLMYKLGI